MAGPGKPGTLLQRVRSAGTRSPRAPDLEVASRASAAVVIPLVVLVAGVRWSTGLSRRPSGAIAILIVLLARTRMRS
ncbi:hypothetical protein E3O19_17445 [Cryobacterium algoritolerans]|uniref:Uncharacterized protein n=1 Tax=Cryobacterium algoritolerans TaxID=1259184 RepID=A0A4R8WLQ5_9MICO|nr:hypothetical protein [Cryobacterium algoritolerans]TFC09196.1 hypothetical protein E3O19_17445 [Cryobacterium algoritolerans]